jgi:alkylated DNA nucleotide flippase Atl1
VQAKAPVGFNTSATAPVNPLDEKFGYAAPPAYIKHYEADKSGRVLINPYLQVASKDFPAVLVVKEAPYNWVIDAGGNVAIIPEAAHPYGRTYPNGFFRPEDQSVRKPGTRENYGHVSALAGTPGRISGEILYDKDTNSWIINNKSGRYTKHNPDRSPEQLLNAATLIREVVDPGKTPWGQVFFLLEYSSDEMRAALLKSPKIQYDDPAKKARPHLIVMGGGATTFKPEEMPKVAATSPAVVATPAAAAAPSEAAAAKPAKVRKAKAAQNDDPS